MSVLAGPSRTIPSPPAARATRRSWRDPRLAVGLLLVFGSVLVGSRVLAQADDTVSVLAARAPLAAGQQIAAADVAPIRLRFASAEDADRYVAGTTPVPAGTVLLRPVGAGELVPRAALGSGDVSAIVDLPLAVDPVHVPAGLASGSVVDVWATPGLALGGTRAASPGSAAAAGGDAELVLDGVPVLSVSAGGLGDVGGLRQVVVGVPVEQEERLSEVLAAVAGEATVVLVRRPR